MSVAEHRAHAVRRVVCAVLTVSDTRAARTDETGALIVQMLEGRGHRVLEKRIVKDELDQIRKRLGRWLAHGRIRGIIVNGGTGVSGRDVTVEAVRPLLDKELPGFGELLRLLSYRKIGPASMMSRCMGGIARGKVVFCLPGSPEAAELAMEKLILPELGHCVRELNK